MLSLTDLKHKELWVQSVIFHKKFLKFHAPNYMEFPEQNKSCLLGTC